jgi:hypothetical protein
MIRLSMIRGDTRPMTVTLTDENGNPIDLDTLSAITFTAKLRYDDTADTSTTIVKTLDDGVVIEEPATDGVCTITIEPVDTSDLDFWWSWSRVRFAWDIQVIDDYEQATRTVARGHLYVYRDVTVATA